MSMKLKKNDTVQVIAGKDKGKTGTILQVFPNRERIVVDGIAMMKRHIRGTKGQTGRIVERPATIHVSNVMIIDPDTKKPTRIRIQRKEGVRTRVSVKTGAILK